MLNGRREALPRGFQVSVLLPSRTSTGSKHRRRISILEKREADLGEGMIEHRERSRNLALDSGGCGMTTFERPQIR